MPRSFSLISEVEVVEVNGIGILVPVSIVLPVDGHTPPVLARGPMWASHIEGIRLAIQGDGLEDQLVIIVSRNLENEVVPGVAHRIASKTGVYPMLVNVIPSIPLMTPGDTALMSPNEAHAVEELVDVELQRLRGFDVLHKKINVVGE